MTISKLLTVAATTVGFSLCAHAQDVSFGDRLFHEKADCQFCHGPDGDGRGDPRSPGQAANLHKTILNRDQLIEVVACGRPGTEMPHFDKYAYEDKTCYGATAADLGADVPHDPHSTPLSRREIEAVADFVIKTYVGQVTRRVHAATLMVPSRLSTMTGEWRYSMSGGVPYLLSTIFLHSAL